VKIFNNLQFREWDAISIHHQGLRSIELMERAATKLFEWISGNFENKQLFYIFCGKGNNGGDGLALARQLIIAGKEVRVFILETGSGGSPDFFENLHRLHQLTPAIVFCQNAESFPFLSEDGILVDALFGTGLNKPLDGLALELIRHLQKHRGITLAIDLPSGLFSDGPSKPQEVLPATHTLSFQSYKLALLMDDNGLLVGNVHILDIGLSQNFEKETDTLFETIEESLIQMIIRPRNPFGHKGTFGNACLVAGQHGMMGAAVLAARACLASGAGKTTLCVPEEASAILPAVIPEALCEFSGKEKFERTIPFNKFQSVGIGPGIGTDEKTRQALLHSLPGIQAPYLLDADALNLLQVADFRSFQHKECVITPHPLEFDRLFGKSQNVFNRINLAQNVSMDLGIYIVLKGHHTCIFTPKGKVYINTNGNDGMAKGGSGDVLTGLITGLLAQGYPLPEAAILGVFLHGSAGDLATAKYSRHSMQPSHIIECLAEVWKKLE